MPLPPFIVNLAPLPDELSTGLTAPVRFSVRDVDTFVAPDLIRVTIGYAKVRASGAQPFEEVLERTDRSSVLFGAVDNQTPPTITPVMEGIELTKTIAGLQRSVYFTKLDAGSGFRSAMVTADVHPITITDGQPGAVFGMEHGPRRTGAYLFFERSGGTPRLRFCGPANNVGTRVPNQVLSVDWTGTSRYFIVWNEIRGKVELYRISAGTTSLLHEADISTFQQFDPIPGGTPQRGGNGDVVLVYGIEGQVGEKVVLSNVAVSADVGAPIFGLIRTGEYLTTRRSDETVRFEGGHPIKAPISSWFGPDDRFFADPDDVGTIKALTFGTARITKNTSGDSMAIYREEPGLLTSDVNGFMLEAVFSATATQLISGRITGMGFMLFDGQSVFYLGLLSGPTRTVGLLRSGGSVVTPASFATPDTDLDWLTAAPMRFVVDPRRELIELYGADLVTPLMSLPFDRSDLPDATDFGLVGEPAFIAFGHISAIATRGFFDLGRLIYGTAYQAYEASDGALPDAAPTDPIWTGTAGGFDGGVPNPLFGLALLGGGFGILPIGLYVDVIGPSNSSMVDGQLVIDTAPGVTQTFRRLIPISPERGAVVEFQVQITNHKPRTRTGFFVIIDDGLKAYAVSFVDTEIGKFIAIPIRSGSGLVEVVGTERQAAKLSAKVDWDQPHVYRFERRPLDGTYLFIDNHPLPALFIPDSDRIDYPNSQFGGVPSVAFGNIGSEGARSVTTFVRVLYSEGYEISTKKVDTTAKLEEDIRSSRAMVIAFVKDDDP